MCKLPTTYRELRILLQSLTLLHYKDAVVDSIRVSELEFNMLMDKIGACLGDELRRRELANAHHQDALTPAEDRRTYTFPPGEIVQYPGPDRRDMRNKALLLGLTNVHQHGSDWFAEDQHKVMYVYHNGQWQVNGC